MTWINTADTFGRMRIRALHVGFLFQLNWAEKKNRHICEDFTAAQVATTSVFLGQCSSSQFSSSCISQAQGISPILQVYPLIFPLCIYIYIYISISNKEEIQEDRHILISPYRRTASSFQGCFSSFQHCYLFSYLFILFPSKRSRGAKERSLGQHPLTSTVIKRRGKTKLRKKRNSTQTKAISRPLFRAPGSLSAPSRAVTVSSDQAVPEDAATRSFLHATWQTPSPQNSSAYSRACRRQP